MKRDFDLIRRILLEVEDKYTPERNISLKPDDVSWFSEYEWGNVVGHFVLLEEGGYLHRGSSSCDRFQGMIVLNGISWKGYELLDEIRDEILWRKTKQGASQIGSFSVDTIKDVAKALVRKKIKDLTDGEFTLGGDEA